MIPLKQFRDQAKGLPDILNYAACVAPGVYLNKDGSLMAGFDYRAPDIFSATELDRNVLAKRINSVISRFGTGWAFHIDAVRKPVHEYPKAYECHFPDPVSAMIDQERRELFLSKNDMYETVNVITLTYMQPADVKGRITDMMYEDGHESKESPAEKNLAYFQLKLEEFMSLSSNAFITIEQMLPIEEIDQYGNYHYRDEFLRYVSFCITGRDHPVYLPPISMYLDNFIGAYEFYTGVIPKVDQNYIGIVALEGYPQESFPNILDDLSHLAVDYRWNTRFVALDAHEALDKLNKMRKKWKQKEQSFITLIFNPHSTKFDQHAVQMVSEVDSAMADLNSGLISYGYYSSNIIIMDSDRERLDHNTKEMARIIEANGFSARIEGINAVEAWLGSLPGHVVPNIRQTLVSSFNVSHMMPLSSIWSGDRYNDSDKYPPKAPPLMYTLTSGSTPFRLNLHVSDIGHTLIFGPTGSGKSTLLAMLVAQHRRYVNDRVFAFDKGMSLFPFCKASGGDHFDVAGDGDRLSFAPLSNLQNKSDQSWAETWISTMLVLQNITLLPRHKELIHEAMNLHIDQGSTSLTEFISNLQDEELRSALGHYAISGPMGYLLDAEEDALQLSDFAVFEIEELMNLKDEDAVPVLLYLFWRIEKSLDGRPTMLVLDEAWLMLGHPVFKEKIREWLKVLRKANCAVILATQSLSDAAHSGILDVLQESCPTKIMLPNPEAFNKGTENNFGPYDFYKQFGLNDRQIEIIADALPKREYYYYSPKGTRLFNLALGDIALAFVGASGKNDIKAVQRLVELYGEDWVPHWLEGRGIDPQYYYDQQGDANED